MFRWKARQEQRPRGRRARRPVTGLREVEAIAGSDAEGGAGAVGSGRAGHPRALSSI